MNNNNKIDFTKNYIIEYKDKMPLKKSHHSILFHDDNLYIIGGFDDNKKTSKECFYFSYINKTWHNMPNLNIPRANSSICLYNKSTLYLFRGRNDEGELNSIEYINIKEIEKNIWKIINVIDYGLVWNSLHNSCILSYEENKILIFGGEDENKLYRESFLFDLVNNNVYRGMDLKIPAAFKGQGVYNNGKIYGFDFKNKNGDYEHKLHIFDIQNNIWSIICYENNN
jgi:N-acetylneuraminic acid mutarotase